MAEHFGLPPDGLGGFRLDLKIQRGGKPQSPQQAQTVFLKPPIRQAHCPNQPVVQIGQSAMALTVKSRRAKSSSTEAAGSTKPGLLPSW